MPRVYNSQCGQKPQVVLLDDLVEGGDVLWRGAGVQQVLVRLPPDVDAVLPESLQQRQRLPHRPVQLRQGQLAPLIVPSARGTAQERRGNGAFESMHPGNLTNTMRLFPCLSLFSMARYLQQQKNARDHDYWPYSFHATLKGFTLKSRIQEARTNKDTGTRDLTAHAFRMTEKDHYRTDEVTLLEPHWLHLRMRSTAWTPLTGGHQDGVVLRGLT